MMRLPAADGGRAFAVERRAGQPDHLVPALLDGAAADLGEVAFGEADGRRWFAWSLPADAVPKGRTGIVTAFGKGGDDGFGMRHVYRSSDRMELLAAYPPPTTHPPTHTHTHTQW